MAKTELPVSEYVKQGIFVLIILAIALFGIKSCRKYQKKRAIIIELTSHTSDSASYEQFYAADARATLLKAMYQLHLAAELGHTPAEMLKEVMEEPEGLIDTENKAELPASKQLIREALLSNYENCKKLGIFSDPSNLLTLEKGEELPTIKSGPSAGEEVMITHIIPTSVLAGVDKLLPNLVISPPADETGKPTTKRLNNFEIARAKKFAGSLSRAGLIERDALQKITEYYDKAAAEVSEPKMPDKP